MRVVFVSQSDDIAVLELEKRLPADRAIPGGAYSKPRVGRNVVVMGYPLWYMLGEGSPSLTNGMVSKRTGLKDDLGTFQLTANVNKGDSGGPVFDSFGNVVGITVGKLDKLAEMGVMLSVMMVPKKFKKQTKQTKQTKERK